jgi:predicted nucleic acid-binding protein
MATVDLSDPNTPLPEFLMVDASLLLVLRPGSTHRHRTAAQAFLRRVGQASLDGHMMCLVPGLVLEECYFKIIQAQIRRLDPNWHAHYKAHPQVIQQCIGAITAFRRSLQALPVFPVTVEDLANPQAPATLEDRMRHFIAACNLLPKDGYILAVAERLNVTNLATLDHDWCRATQFTVYTTQ